MSTHLPTQTVISLFVRQVRSLFLYADRGLMRLNKHFAPAERGHRMAVVTITSCSSEASGEERNEIDLMPGPCGTVDMRRPFRLN